MAIETLGEAFSAGWRVTVRCSWGPRDGMKRVRECVYGGELDLQNPRVDEGLGVPVGEAGEPLKMPSVRITAGAAGVFGATNDAANAGIAAQTESLLFTQL